MSGRIGIGYQDFERIRVHHNFYVDKTGFIREWWEEDDAVTLITRPRRFGKTLTMSMIEKFFSIDYVGRGELFEGLSIWEEEKYRQLQGTRPVISLSFANVKERDYVSTVQKICQMITELYNDKCFLLKSGKLSEEEKAYFRSISMNMPEVAATLAIHRLTTFLYRYYEKRVVILLDEYDTPMQEAYVNGYWDELSEFMRNLFHASFKTNPYLDRAIMTGITRISKESIFSDLNNLEVVTTTSDKYADCFGFTEEKVFQALDEYGLSSEKEQVKSWYDGFQFGGKSGIYNPWSILNYLDKRKLGNYWTNTSSNSLVSKLIREGSSELKQAMESLLRGETFETSFDEQIVFDQLDKGEDAVWSLLLAGGYLKAERCEFDEESGKTRYALRITNREVYVMFLQMIEGWFRGCRYVSNTFLQALFAGDLEEMNDCMNTLAEELFSSFDTGKTSSGKAQPERFYHGFVLGLMVELKDRYVITSNGESGFGRYDIMLEPKEEKLDAFVIEFKVVHAKRGEKLEDGVRAALEQIEDRKYEAALRSRGIPAERIRKYGFAFCGKEVLIGGR